MSTWLRRETNGDAVLSLHVQPGARRSEIAGIHGEALKIRLAAPPVDGKANDCLIGFVAELLDRPRADVVLISGAASRKKRLRVHGATTQALARLLPGGPA